MVLPIVVVIALIAGLAAAGAVLFILNRRRRAKGAAFRGRGGGASIGLVVLAFVATAAAVGGILYATSHGDGRPEKRLLDSIQRHHPEAAPEIAAIAAETNRLAAQKRAASLAQRYFPRHLPTTSDEAVLRFTAEMTKVFETLRKRDPESCRSLAAGGSMGDSLDAGSLQPTLDAMADVIDDSVDKAQPPPDAAQAQRLLSGMVERIYAKPDDSLVPPQTLAQPQLVPADKLCNTMIAFYREILALPPRDGSTVVRVLMRASGQAR